MKLKYSPCKTDHDSRIVVVSVESVTVDGSLWEFDGNDAVWEPSKLVEATDGAILEAHRVDGELYITVRRFYSSSCSEWDDGEYHAVEMGATV